MRYSANASNVQRTDVFSAAARLVTGTWKYQCGLSRLMHDDLQWLVIPKQVQYKLAVAVHRCLRHRPPRYLADYCVPVSEVADRQHLRSARCHQLSVPRVRAAPLGPVHFLSPDWESGIHCLIICGIQLLTPNDLGPEDVSVRWTFEALALKGVVIALYKSAFTFTYIFISVLA